MHTIHTGTAGNRFESNGQRFIRAASVTELEQRPFKVVTLEDRHILLLRADVVPAKPRDNSHGNVPLCEHVCGCDCSGRDRSH